MTAGGSITLTATDDAADTLASEEDNLTISSGATVESTGSDVSLQGGDDVTVEAGARVAAAGKLTIAGDFGNADTAGSLISVLGEIDTVTPGEILGEADSDTITLNPQALSSGSLLIDGQGGDDDYTVQLGNLGGAVDVQDQAGEGTADQLTIVGTSGADSLSVDASNTSSGSETVTYGAELEDLSVEGGVGDDSFEVTPSSTATINIFGGDPTTSPGDTLSFNTPAGETSTFTNLTADSGTVVTSGIFLDVVYDEIETRDQHGSLTFPGRIPGNVRAYLSGTNDLIVIPDTEDNAFQIAPNGSGEIVVTGLAGTTINGVADFNFSVASAGLPLDDLQVLGTAGRDLINLQGFTVEGNAIIQAGDGVDAIDLFDVTVEGNLRVYENDGDGFVDLNGGQFTGVAQIIAGEGDNTVTVKDAVFASVMSFTGGSGKDRFSLSGGSVGASTQLNSGGGDDLIELIATDHNSTLYINTAAGNDTVRGNDVDVASTLSLNTGTEDDVIDFNLLDAHGTAIVQPGTGDDAVRFQHSTFAGLVNMFFASGNNVVDLDDNDFGNRVYVQTYSGVLAARIQNNTFDNLLVLRGGSGGTDVLAVDVVTSNTFTGLSPIIVGFEGLDGSLAGVPFESLLVAAYP